MLKNQTSRIFILSVIVLALSFTTQAQTVFSYDITTTGNDVHWVSANSMTPNSPGYDYQNDITLITADIEFMGIPIGTTDVTGEIPADLLHVTGNAAGPAPASLYQASFVYPDPPAPVTMAADLDVGLDVAGFGYLNATNITLGSLTIDLAGSPVTVDIVGLRVVGAVTTTTSQFGNIEMGLAGTGDIEPYLSGTGSLAGGTPMSLDTIDMIAGLQYLVIGFVNLNAPFKGGTLVASPDFIITLPTNFSLGATWPAGLPAGFNIYFQSWVPDSGAIKGFAATNGLRATTP